MKHFCQLCSTEMVLDDVSFAQSCRQVIEDCGSTGAFKAQAAMEAAFSKWLPQVVHDACAEAHVLRSQTQAQKLMIHRRNQRWLKACPKAFQETEYHRVIFAQKAEALTHVAAGGSALLNGESGRGKTRLVWLMARAPFLSGKSVTIWTHIGLSKHLAAEAMRGAQWLNLTVGRMSECDLLIIDDLGKAKMMGADGQSLQNEDLLFEILDRRLSHGRQMVITTNDDRQTLMARMTEDKGQPFIRRLNDLCKSFHG